MDDLVDQILQTYELMRKIDAPRVENSREKIAAYLETLNSAGRLDAQQLAMYGLAYLNFTRDLTRGSPAASFTQPGNSVSSSKSSGRPLSSRG
jgi:hypothetical protein